MITINGKKWTKNQLEKLIIDSELIAECIKADLHTIKENEESMDLKTYKKFSKKYDTSNK